MSKELRHTNIMTDNGFNIYEECVSRCVHMSPQEEEVHLFFLRGQ